MANPTSSLATLRPDLGGSLEEFSLQADRAGFIGLRAAPVLEVRKQAGVFGKIPIEELLKDRTTNRAPGSGYNRGNFRFTTATFATEEHGVEEPVDDREAQMYREYFDAELIAAERARDVVLRNFEKRLHTLLFNATTWTGASLTTALTNEWDDAADATPINDVDAAKRKVYEASGLWPNALIINRYTFMDLRISEQIIERLHAQGAGVPVTPAQIGISQLMQVFDLEMILVAGGSKDSAAEGQASTPAQIWDREYAMVAKIARTNDVREPCVARTFHWGEDGSQIGALIESYRDETVRADIIRARMDTDELVMYTEAAHLLSNVYTV